MEKQDKFEQFLEWLDNMIEHLKNIKKMAIQINDWDDLSSITIKLKLYQQVRAEAELSKAPERIKNWLNQQKINIMREKNIYETEENYEYIPNCNIKLIAIDSILKKYSTIIKSKKNRRKI